VFLHPLQSVAALYANDTVCCNAYVVCVWYGIVFVLARSIQN